ncbi:MAG: glycosyltransferase, partial [Terricaulis sp.]
MSASPVASVVVAVLNEAENVAEVCDEILRAMTSWDNFEIVWVDDGSTDDTPARLSEIARRDPRVRLVRHDRRCGKSQAVRTG